MAKSTSKNKEAKNSGAGADDTLLQQLFLDSLKDIYYAEKHIAKTLPFLQQPGN